MALPRSASIRPVFRKQLGGVELAYTLESDTEEFNLGHIEEIREAAQAWGLLEGNSIAGIVVGGRLVIASRLPDSLKGEGNLPLFTALSLILQPSTYSAVGWVTPYYDGKSYVKIAILGNPVEEVVHRVLFLLDMIPLVEVDPESLQSPGMVHAGIVVPGNPAQATAYLTEALNFLGIPSGFMVSDE